MLAVDDFVSPIGIVIPDASPAGGSTRIRYAGGTQAVSRFEKKARRGVAPTVRYRTVRDRSEPASARIARSGRTGRPPSPDPAGSAALDAPGGTDGTVPDIPRATDDPDAHWGACQAVLGGDGNGIAAAYLLIYNVFIS